MNFTQTPRFFSLSFCFQAEDGIRDGHATGVQTCALPISTRTRPSNMPSERTSRRRGSSLSGSEERRVGKSVDLGGRRIIKKKKKERNEKRKKNKIKNDGKEKSEVALTER